MSAELVIVAAVVLLNGFLALAEVAIISVRRSRLRKLAAAGNTRARTVLELSAVRWKFLAVVRLGVTLAAVAGGVVAGAAFVDPVAAWLNVRLGLAVFALPVAVLVVIAALAMVSFVFGEVFLKRFALIRPERAAMSVVQPLKMWSRIVEPLVSGLTRAADALLRRLGLGPAVENRISDEEVTSLIEQGLREGVFHKSEKDMVQAVMALDRMSVMTIMTPRPTMVWLDLEDPDEVNWRKIVASGHSYFPACEGTPDRIVGMLSVKALWANSAAGFATSMRDLLIKPLLIPESTTGVELLEAFKRAGRRVALVHDEFGTVSGMVTLIDVLEAIVGDLPARGKQTGPRARAEGEGSWTIDATMPLADLKVTLGVADLPGEATADFQTLGGLVMTHVGRIPRVGDAFSAGGFHWEVVAMDRFRVDKVKVTRQASAPME